jgi:sorbitol-specific phosphotransferase system component IIC
MEFTPNYFGMFTGLIYILLGLLWITVPVFIFLISKRVKRMLNIMENSQADIKELNVNIKKLQNNKNESNG